MIKQNKIIHSTVIVAGLGYFVDVYDLQLFNIIGKESIMSSRGLGVQDPTLAQQLFDNNLFYWQMAGMLLGGLLWGILGDKKGRKSILFASILLYSLANLANAFVSTLEAYQLVRFVAGVGLAGELGAAITLVSELLSKENRGYGTMIVVTLGAMGAVFAAMVKKYGGQFAILGLENWQMAYIIGGIMGILLLLLRFGTFESTMFEKTKLEPVSNQGNFFYLFKDKTRSIKYIYCILIGLPVWFVILTLIKLAPRYAGIIGVHGEAIDSAYCIMTCYIGLSVGDLFCGWLSQMMKSRKKVVLIYLTVNILLILIYLFVKNISSTQFYFLIFLLGCCTGYWALFVTIASEQFGTNIRATVTTTVPNFVRGAVIPIGLLFFYCLDTLQFNLVYSTLLVGALCFGLAIWAIAMIPESFGKNLDYYE
ncbi:MAG TPA: MFS transporter [Saprospiraceae bacterium]|nr:MFS transporter [Saprospiraceae bacterium]